MNVVIVGGGFAGVKAAHGLLKSKNPSLKVVLISDTPYFLFHATLYSTATGHDESESVIYLKDLFKNDDRLSIAIDSISNLDFNKKFVSGKISRYQYDELIVAIGSVTSYFSISGLKSHVFGVKSLSEVKHFRNHIKNIIMSEHVSNCNFFVIGGGATGVELAASLVFYIEKLCKERKISTKHYKVTLVEASERILPRLSKTASKLVTKRLIKLGISVLNNKKVSKLTDDYILIDDKKIPTHTVMWTSGISNNPFFDKYKNVFALNKRGFVKVDRHLRANKNIFVLGDNNDTKYSGTAWSAVSQGLYVAKYLINKSKHKTTKGFFIINKPASLPVGKSWGYVEWFGVYVSGRTGYLVRRFIELYAYIEIAPLSIAINAWKKHSIYYRYKIK